MSQDLYQAPDYFLMDELLTNEHKLIREDGREILGTAHVRRIQRPDPERRRRHEEQRWTAGWLHQCGPALGRVRGWRCLGPPGHRRHFHLRQGVRIPGQRRHRSARSHPGTIGRGPGGSIQTQKIKNQSQVREITRDQFI